MIVNKINYELLVLSLHRARELKLDYEFIEILEEEVTQREQEDLPLEGKAE
ncbi:sporulation histidine kinase inhibitor Sda [Halobacillus salinus]|uniref:Sporulation histidine kinase inhibitor Sda n=1 Tax=Halobacillus salinus TaxID=192814 RepID=A0A4Z0GZQ7_9BACI|nr:sporulation histidine kinase inhibitor Sda [Halobacillus salinus]TGB02753.1 sporulation histidine kinase inhibitor Sda [Halobacillus salinus]